MLNGVGSSGSRYKTCWRVTRTGRARAGSRCFTQPPAEMISRSAVIRVESVITTG